jgi:DNA-binding GntR family transcriptional regulator
LEASFYHFHSLTITSLDFFDSGLKRHFHETHEKIFHLIEEKKAREAERLMREDILDTKARLKGFKEKGSPPSDHS